MYCVADVFKRIPMKVFRTNCYINLPHSNTMHVQDMEELESLLKSSNARVKVIVTDGVFSIKGTVAPLQ